MSEDDVALEMPMPLDADGFLRRECPTCEREFKWHHTSEEEGTSVPVADGGYFCPYCGVQAEVSSWLTQGQIELAQNMLATQVLGPVVRKLGDDIKGIGRSSGGLLRADVKYDAPDALDPLTEVDDMTRVDFECHPTEPLKVLDNWDRPIHCLVCGKPNS